MKKISITQREYIVSLLKQKKSVRNVASLTGVSHMTVSQIRAKYLPKQSSLSNGRPRTLTARQERYISRLAASGKIVTAADIKRHLENDVSTVVSTSTVQRTLRRCGLKSRVRRKKPLLRPMHRSKRLDFAKKYKNWTMNDWNRVIWSDETKINLF